MKTIRYIVSAEKIKSRLAAGAIVLLVVMFAATAFADAVDDGLPPDAPQIVKTSARQAIQNGLGQENVLGLTRAMLQNKFDAQQIQLAHALMIEAQNSGMPVQPLMNKAYEGMAKGVDPSLIVGAIERVHSRNAFAFQRAAPLSGNKSQTANLGRTLSAALAAGFSKADADKVTEMIRRRVNSISSNQAYSLALECFQAARDVSRLGVSSQATTNMLTAALSKEFSHQDMRAMRNAFMVQAQHSRAQNLAHRYSTAIQEGKGFQEGPGNDADSSGGGAGGSGSGNSGSGASGGNAGGGSGGSGSDSGAGSGGSGGSGPGHGKQ